MIPYRKDVQFVGNLLANVVVVIHHKDVKSVEDTWKEVFENDVRIVEKINCSGTPVRAVREWGAHRQRWS